MGKIDTTGEGNTDGRVVLMAEGVSLSFPNRSRPDSLVLRDVCLKASTIIPEGQAERARIVALMGPSGIGKTSLMRILTGLLKPDAGTVLANRLGSDGSLSPVRPGAVGFLAQDCPLFAHHTTMGNLLAAGRGTSMNPAQVRARAEGVLEHFGLYEWASHYPAQLSGGQRQRVSLAQQFLRGVSVLMLDEPFSGLDPPAVEATCAFLREATRREGAHVLIIVTDDIHAALSIADTVWLLGRDRDARGDLIPGARLQEVIPVGGAFAAADLLSAIRATFKEL